MTRFDGSTAVIGSFLILVLLSSGCIEGGSTDLNPDFDLDYTRADLNRSGMELYQGSVSAADNVSEYDVSADSRMAMNLPVISLTVNMTSEGVFQSDTSEINSSGVMGINVAGSSNSTMFSTYIANFDNVSVVETESMGEENRTEVERYTREELGFSLEALRDIGISNASVLGVSGQENESLLLRLEANSSNLMANSADIFEKYSPVQDEVEDGQSLEDQGSFEESEAYLWADRESLRPEKLAYYGSVNNGSLQVRVETEYSGY